MRRLGLLSVVLLLSWQGSVADNAPFNITDYEGKVVVLDFWASWCVPCRRSFPWLNEMHARYGDDGLVIIGVNLDQERSEAEAFLQEFPAQFQIYFDVSKALATEYEVVAMPSSYLLGPDGEILKRHYGFKVKKQEEYEAAIVAALESLK
jgi:thiol-disulfide isomerase/thioredoxin